MGRLETAPQRPPMITTTILAILGVLLIIVIALMFRGPSGRAVSAPAKGQPPMPSAIDAHPWDARKGDVISIRGGAEDYSDLDFTVDRRSAYQTSSHRWVDLSGDFRGRRVYLEVYGRNSAELMGILDPRKLTIADLNLTEQQLADFDSRQDPNATINFESKRWNYDSSREIGYLENETGEGEGLYRWLFREQDGDRLLCVEKWEGEPFDVRIARRLSTQDITVYRAA
jgi:hypothetical protein